MTAAPRVAALALAATCLVAGVMGGLARLGAPPFVADAASLHALMMIGGFLGTVIGLERAVALGSTPALGAPLAAGAGALLILTGWSAVGEVLIAAAPLLLFIASGAIVLRQAQLPTVLLAVAAFAWAIGNGLYLQRAPLDAVAAWWFAFLVLTIAAERLEMTRFMQRRAIATPLFAGLAALLLGGATALAAGLAEGAIAYGMALAGLAAWLFVFDVARRTVLTQGLARYAAVALLTGYAWLAIAGVAWASVGGNPALRDTAMHALGLGFVFSMILAHGPIILPAVARVRVRYTPFFYLPLALLHASLVLRLLAGAEPALRLAGGALNAAAVALFAATLLVSLRAHDLDQRTAAGAG